MRLRPSNVPGLKSLALADGIHDQRDDPLLCQEYAGTVVAFVGLAISRMATDHEHAGEWGVACRWHVEI